MDIPSLCTVCFTQDKQLFLITKQEFSYFNVLFPENRELLQSLHSKLQLKLCKQCNDGLRNVQIFIETAQRSLKSLSDYHSSKSSAPTISRSEIISNEIPNEHLTLHVKDEPPEDEKCDTKFDEDPCMNLKLVYGGTDAASEQPLHETEIVFSAPLQCTTRRKTCKRSNSTSEGNVRIKVEGNERAVNTDNIMEKCEEPGNTNVENSAASTAQLKLKDRTKEKKETPVNESKRLWHLIQVLWVSSEQANAWYDSEIQQITRPDCKETCDQCKRCFATDKELKCHYFLCHKTLGAMSECDICNYKFTTKIHLYRHVREHYCLYTCKVCRYESRSLLDLKTHCVDHEESVDASRRMNYQAPHGYPYWCKKCKTYFAEENQLSDHAARYGCAALGARCADCLQLFNHKEKYTHSCKFRRESCKECAETFKSWYFRKIHECVAKRSVGEAGRYYCAECDQRFATSSNYSNHLRLSRAHNGRDGHAKRSREKKHECPHCERKFNSQKYLQGHIAKLHLQVGEFRCHDCDKSYVTRRRLNVHVSKHHHVTHVTVKDKMCDICGRAFELECSLRNHLRTHTGERPYRCDTCGDTFRQQNTLWSHNKVVHLKEKLRSRPQWPR